MPLLLNIDTATEHASVCISRRGDVLEMVASSEQKNHASFVQPAIQALLRATGLELSEMAAIAVTAGPGSYTGLRVGLASAKGICYVLGKPLIMVNTLEVMAQAAREYYQLK
ncbi:MAG: TsaB protein required for threonylcarbamoyladenosine ((6)A) formation in tRNA, partial [Sediminibacterium sp.]|nr:TsaB protein required for threonylcarbamoyladenosine ((6)A) formation in tRNA [Sediminibacterium sp.]